MAKGTRGGKRVSRALNAMTNGAMKQLSNGDMQTSYKGYKIMYSNANNAWSIDLKKKGIYPVLDLQHAISLVDRIKEFGTR